MKFNYKQDTIEFDADRVFSGNPVLQPTKIATGGTSGVNAYHNEPNLVYTADHAILCVYRTGPFHTDNTGYIACKRSLDNGATWSNEIVVADDPTLDTRNQTVGIDPVSGRVTVFFRTYDATIPEHKDVWYTTSEDNGLTWAAPTNMSSFFFDRDTGTITCGVTGTNTFSRTAGGSGSFITDGFEVGQVVFTSGFTAGANNGTFKIQSLTATTMTVTTSTSNFNDVGGAPGLVNESGTGNERILYDIVQVNPFGPIVSTSNGLMQMLFGVQGAPTVPSGGVDGLTIQRAWVFFSTDGGQTWGNLTPVYDRSAVSGRFGEPAPIAIDENRLVIFVRDEASNANTSQRRAYIYKSTDGGLTWQINNPSSQEWTTATAVNHASPYRGQHVNGNVYLSWGSRIETTNDVSAIYTAHLAAEVFFVQPAWILNSVKAPRTRQWMSPVNITSTASTAEFAYPAILGLPNGMVLVAWYDSNDGTNTTDTTTWIKSI